MIHALLVGVHFEGFDFGFAITIMDALYQPDTLDALYGSGAGDTTPVKATKAPPQSSPPNEKKPREKAKVKLPKPTLKGQSGKAKAKVSAKAKASSSQNLENKLLKRANLCVNYL